MFLISFKVITTIKRLIRDAAASIHAQMIIHKIKLNLKEIIRRVNCTVKVVQSSVQSYTVILTLIILLLVSAAIVCYCISVCVGGSVGALLAFPLKMKKILKKSYEIIRN